MWRRTTPMNFRPFDWQGLSLIQGSIIFMDEQEGERIDLQNLQVRTDPGMEFGYHISYRIKSMRQAASAEVAAARQVQCGPCVPSISLSRTRPLHTEVQALRRGRTRPRRHRGDRGFRSSTPEHRGEGGQGGFRGAPAGVVRCVGRTSWARIFPFSATCT